MISELVLRDFRAFSTYKASFRKENVLVGPNSAGKSTILIALRFARACLRSAYRLRPTLAVQHRGLWVQAYPVPSREFEVLHESVRHEFRDIETSLALRWKNSSSLTVVWPASGSEELPYFYLRNNIGNVPRSIGQIKSEFADIASVPTLSPLEHEEEVLTSDYVRQNLDTRRASRHFRNQLLQLSSDGMWDDFYEFAAPWLGGYELVAPRVAYALGGEPGIDLYYQEPGSRTDKEVVWAGDGFQIWLQLLLQLYRGVSQPTVLLDEPEVFLHPDLQRRLMRLLSATSQQYVFATHSAEVLAEVDPKAILWVDKTRRRAIRNPRQESLDEMSNALGSSFNLALARVLRARGVLFVEGEDAKILRALSRTLGMRELVNETRLAVVPISGFSNWQRAEGFGWVAQEFLDGAVKGFVLLDRDYRTDEQVDAIEKKIKASGIVVHTWAKKELESYLLNPDVIARLSRAPGDAVQRALDQAVAAEESHCFAQITTQRMETESSSGLSVPTLMERSQARFSIDWLRPEYRIDVAPPKDVLSSVNRSLQAGGFKAVSFEAIAKSMSPNEIHAEMTYVLEKIEDLAS